MDRIFFSDLIVVANLDIINQVKPTGSELWIYLATTEIYLLKIMPPPTLRRYLILIGSPSYLCSNHMIMIHKVSYTQ